MIERIKSVTLEELVQRAERDRAEVMNTYTRGQAALELAEMALEHGGSGSESAAHLLIAMEYSQPFSFQDLLSFDDRNRAKADVMLLGYKPHHLWPSAWITEETDQDGRKLIEAVRQKWGVDND